MNNIELYELEKKSNKNCAATPPQVVKDIYKIIHIENYKSIWLPFDNYDSAFKLIAEEMKLKYKATHKYDADGNDFFITDPPPNCDLMISNPPFDIQNGIIERSFYLIDKGWIKSFALLLPLSTLETPKRANMYEKYVDKLSVIIFKKRIKFLGCEGSFNTACCWVCYNIDAIKNKLNWL